MQDCSVFLLLPKCQSRVVILVLPQPGPGRGLDCKHVRQRHQLGQQRHRRRGSQGLACAGLAVAPRVMRKSTGLDMTGGAGSSGVVCSELCACDAVQKKGIFHIEAMIIQM